jgi:ABC-type transporter MlaC component
MTPSRSVGARVAVRFGVGDMSQRQGNARPRSGARRRRGPRGRHDGCNHAGHASPGPLGALCLLLAPGARAGASTPPAPSKSADECAGATRAADPLDELRRSDAALATALKRRVPDWSPEAEALAARVDRLLADILDYEAIARQALGPHWDALTPRQRAAFLALFSPLTNRALIAAANRNVSVSYDSETIAGSSATVVVTPRLPDAEAAARVEYKLGERCGHWRIRDVVVDGESLVDGYRSEIDRLFRRGTFDDLLAVMRKRLGRAAPP